MRHDEADTPSQTRRDSQEHIIEIGNLRPMLIRGALLLLETAVVPTLLLYACTTTVGSFWGLIAVLGWCGLTVATRIILRQPVPSTLLLVVGGLVGRTTIALVFSNVYVYLFQPIVGSLFMAALFLTSAAIGRPVTVWLARDFVVLPAALFRDHRVLRVFTIVSLIWGASRLLDVGLSLGSLKLGGIDAGLLSRGVLSTTLTVCTIALCAVWGWLRMRRVAGVRFMFA